MATYEGTELAYDYCVISTGKLPDYSKIPGLKEGLNDEFSFVVSTFDFDNSKKMAKRLEFVFGEKIIVYHAGEDAFNWWSAVNSAFLLKDHFKKVKNLDIELHVNGEYIHADEKIEHFLQELFQKEGI